MAVANLADLLDRQLALLVDSRYNHGLPANLSGRPGERAAINHGFKALQISVSAWTAEALKLTMPARILALHRMPQPGQGEHGHHRRARLPARARADRAGRRRDADCARQACTSLRHAWHASQVPGPALTAFQQDLAARAADR
jgi:hypothetical protein